MASRHRRPEQVDGVLLLTGWHVTRRVMTPTQLLLPLMRNLESTGAEKAKDSSRRSAIVRPCDAARADLSEAPAATEARLKA